MAPLDVVAVGGRQLGLSVSRSSSAWRRREAVQHREDRVDLPEVSEELRPGAQRVDDWIAAGVTFLAETITASRPRRSSAIVAMPTFGLSVTDA